MTQLGRFPRLFKHVNIFLEVTVETSCFQLWVMNSSGAKDGSPCKHSHRVERSPCVRGMPGLVLILEEQIYGAALKMLAQW